ncbi:DNA-directed RNA polymerase sigma-70 factor [Phytohabitans aurantiacus]|uniref:DNA-directed RNA polymerase sigma-70 factor n=1 Tax=Phytohabitans aurantiacus TaxID=3016789 RepID=A0ABQ5R661_9ACTN|nr:DNA-directed RNA polymerase sigma-70 factor [Phytohabitans aurantiacus]
MNGVSTDTHADTDAAIIQASLGDPDRFAVIYDRYAATLYRYAHQRVGAEGADDVVADAFLSAFRGRGQYDLSRPDARPWLFGILTRKLASHHRKEKARYRAMARAAPDGVLEGPADEVATRVIADAARRPLAAALAALSRGDRDVLLLVAWGQLSYDEVAAALSIPPGTVGSRLNRARRKVREALGGVDPSGMSEEER